MSLLKLPNELLNHICEDLSDEPPLPDWLLELPKIRCASSDIVSFSCVNSRLRQICLPFLFAYLRVNNVQDAQNFKSFCTDNTVCLRLARMLTLTGLCQEEAEITYTLLPKFKRLVCVDLRNLNNGFDFVRQMSEHPTISTVLVELYTPPELSALHGSPSVSWPSSTGLDPSKVVLSHLRLELSHPNPDFPLNEMKVATLYIKDLERLDEDFGSRFFNGLRELTLSPARLINRPVSFSWLSTFTSAHPHLHKIRLNTPTRISYMPSISAFFDESIRMGLKQDLCIFNLTLSRAKIDAQSTQQWQVTEMYLSPRARLVEILTLVSSSFSSIENLAIDLLYRKDIYNVEDVLSALSHFPSLRVVDLLHTFNQLRFEDGLSYDGELDNLEVCIDINKKGLIQCASRLAKATTCLESLYVKETGIGYQPSDQGVKYRLRRHWSLEGWLRICGPNRDIQDDLELELSPRSTLIRFDDY
ncbi:hypothetical protein GYMLUDRAFT_56471 [Collybiopsis luxurians FD-317 M1]|nr:hypothetical protein GYMLUDRAFT_56471 [Collybiopsis luxurians FD-317 M1]